MPKPVSIVCEVTDVIVSRFVTYGTGAQAYIFFHGVTVLKVELGWSWTVSQNNDFIIMIQNSPISTTLTVKTELDELDVIFGGNEAEAAHP